MNIDLLILASGLASRLSNYTHDIIPKYLVNIDNHTGIYYIVNYWCKYVDNIYLVINSRYYNITKYYIECNLQEYANKIIIITYNESNGTAITLSNIINNELIKYNIQNLLISWCDIFPTSNVNIDFNNLNITNNITYNNIYVFTYGDQCRYGIYKNNNGKNEIIHCPKSNGNIIGIYYIQNFKRFVLDDNVINNDIVIYLDKIGIIYEYPILEIIDYGDEDKLLNIINANETNNSYLKCRYFNNLTIIDENKILKRAVDIKGNNIIKKEINWYKYINGNINTNINFIPIIYEYYDNGYLMEYIKSYVPLYKYLHSITIQNNEKINILDTIINKLKTLHNIEYKKQTEEIFMNDIKKEIYEKVINRKAIINNLLLSFGEFEYINDIKINTFEEVLNKCNDIILNYYKTNKNYTYNIIFGDCNFSNILINPENNNDVIFIDPRGYFGDTDIYGIPEYDYSKILYGISGYDFFNSNLKYNISNINIITKSLTFNIEPIIFNKNIIDKYFNKVHKAFVVIHWLSLAEYNKNNIWKCLSSYYYGMYLGTIL